MPVVRCWSRRAGGHCRAGSAVWQGGYADTKPPRAIQAGELSGPALASFTYVNGVATVRNRTRKEAPPDGSPTGPLRSRHFPAHCQAFYGSTGRSWSAAERTTVTVQGASAVILLPT